MNVEQSLMNVEHFLGLAAYSISGPIGAMFFRPIHLQLAIFKRGGMTLLWRAFDTDLLKDFYDAF